MGRPLQCAIELGKGIQVERENYDVEPKSRDEISDCVTLRGRREAGIQSWRIL